MSTAASLNLGRSQNGVLGNGLNEPRLYFDKQQNHCFDSTLCQTTKVDLLKLKADDKMNLARIQEVVFEKVKPFPNDKF